MFIEVKHTWDVVGLLKRGDSTYLRGTPNGSRLAGIAATMGSLSNNFDTTPDSINMLYVDYPNTTNSIKYTPVLHRYDGRTELAFLNRCASGLNEGYNEQGTSTIVVYEIRQ